MTDHKPFVFRFGEFEVREREFLLIKAGESVPVEPKAFRVLLFLLRNPGRLVKKDEILNAVWDDCSVSDNSLTRSIATLRRLLGDDSREPRYIATVETVGYRFVSKVEASENPESQPRQVSPSPDGLSSTPSRNWFSKSLSWWAVGAFVGLALMAGLATAWQLWQRDYFWKNPLDGAKVERLTDFDGDEFDSAISPDGKFAIFSSDRSGQPEVWLTEIGSGDFANITKGSVSRIISKQRHRPRVRIFRRRLAGMGLQMGT